MTSYPAGERCAADHVDAVLAERLGQARHQAGVSRKQVADQMTLAGLRFYSTTIGRIENRERKVTFGEAVQLAAILSVSLADLLMDQERPA